MKESNVNPLLLNKISLGDKEFVSSYIADGNSVAAPKGVNSPLVTALTERSEEEISRIIIADLVKHGETIDQEDEDGNTALMFAVSDKRHQMIKDLLALGADVNHKAKDAMDEFPLLLASRKQDPEILKIVLDAGADLDMQDRDGSTALSIAYNDIETFKTILEAGANPDTKDYFNDATVAHNVICELPFTKALMEAGANFYLTNKDKLSPLDFLARSDNHENIEVIEYLLAEGISFDDLEITSNIAQSVIANFKIQSSLDMPVQVTSPTPRF